MSTLPLLPTSVVGSHGKPGWWFAAVQAHERGEFGPGDLDEMFDDAVDTAIRDMQGAGLDVITDGEVRRTDGYVDTYYRIIKNIEPLPVRRVAGPWGYDQQTRYEAVGRIEPPPGGLGIVKEFEYLKARATRATKATCAGPLTFGSRIHPGTAYRGVVDVAERFAEVINEELKALVGQHLGYSEWHEVTQDQVNRFADATGDQIQSVGRALSSHPNVQRAKYVSQEQQYEEFKVLFSDTPEYLENVGAEVLPSSFRVVPKVKDADAIQEVGAQFDDKAGVREVVFAKDTVDTVLRVSSILNWGILAVAGILLFAAALLIFNTIRMATFARRREIEVMKLVGATNWFVRGPFMLEGLLTGLVGSLAAVLLLFLAREVAVPLILQNMREDPDVHALAFTWTAAILVGVGLGIGAIGSGITLRKFLRV